MIGSLRGRLVVKRPPYLMLDVNGVGYELEAPMTTFYKLPDVGAEIHLYTHLLVREDAQLFFGFSSEQERRLFRTLIKVTGIGAKTALTILSGMEADALARCIQAGDTDRLVRLPGIGKKTAERLILEMRDRLRDWGAGEATPEAIAGLKPQVELGPAEEAVSAMIALGYRPQEASRFVHGAAKDGMSAEEIIREALKASIR